MARAQRAARQPIPRVSEGGAVAAVDPRTSSDASFIELLLDLHQDPSMHDTIRFENGTLTVHSKVGVMKTVTRFKSFANFARQLSYYHFKLVKAGEGVRKHLDTARFVLDPILAKVGHANLLQPWPTPNGADFGATILRGLPRKQSVKSVKSVKNIKSGKGRTKGRSGPASKKPILIKGGRAGGIEMAVKSVKRGKECPKMRKPKLAHVEEETDKEEEEEEEEDQEDQEERNRGTTTADGDKEGAEGVQKLRRGSSTPPTPHQTQAIAATDTAADAGAVAAPSDGGFEGAAAAAAAPRGCGLWGLMKQPLSSEVTPVDGGQEGGGGGSSDGAVGEIRFLCPDLPKGQRRPFLLRPNMSPRALNACFEPESNGLVLPSAVEVEASKPLDESEEMDWLDFVSFEEGEEHD